MAYVVTTHGQGHEAPKGPVRPHGVRTDSEGEDSFEEMGDPYEDFASSEKLAKQVDQD